MEKEYKMKERKKNRRNEKREIKRKNDKQRKNANQITDRDGKYFYFFSYIFIASIMTNSSSWV